MENIREIVRENLVRFRKEKKLTQIELAEKIGYSDKAISRWETGEVTPDVETLNSLAELYGIKIAAFFEKDAKTTDKKSKEKKAKKPIKISKKFTISLISIVSVWLLAK
ncbi:MAG: helix-turn-helix transcriptional regulator, partial [Clostridia bacterium]|nr:helix-turn-helix transcriptional regulator [Clostridia bacterium]